MKKALIWLMVFLLSAAQAEGLTVTPAAGGFSYRFEAEEPFYTLRWATDAETAQCTVYAQDGQFSGDIALPHTVAASQLQVTVETLKGKELYAAQAVTPAVEQAAAQNNLPAADPAHRLYDVEITPLIHAMRVRFRAPGRPSLLLKYRSSTEKGAVILFPGEDFWYECVLALPYTYASNNVVLTVADAKNKNDLYEIMLRTAYETPQAPAQGEGRLSGVTVCIDPGHQETAKQITEAVGPGLNGTKKSDLGMARGTVTRRLEAIVVLEIAFLLRDELVKQGATVVMTRETQEGYVSNIRRAEIAAEADADFLLRLHCNLRDTEATQGIGIYCPFGSDYAKAIAGEDEWRAMGDTLLFAMQSATGQAKGNTALTNRFIGNNWALMPSFLIEMGYMSNPVEDVLLSAPAYQRMLAAGMAEGVYQLAVRRGLVTAP